LAILIPSSTSGRPTSKPGQSGPDGIRLEKDLWPAAPKDYKQLSEAQRATYSDDLVKNTAILHDRVPKLDFSADEIANWVPRGLLDEGSDRKITW
jgi:iron uptake system component EfeO